ncbi:hypothetical protein DOTSEDRAFT_38933 [Dothistroma septosporum NZE10]|uniref:SnoaL-like domain-containing protein n=1 Tax=Dothistroma septosporum (strain NZE10 / CBS 128990) TaxID=675120 RepID=M2Y037_DOTSN|nr:hypothetical protein DOTSEDRAFT_38933 [Dothistroma septosporum NZE10]
MSLLTPPPSDAGSNFDSQTILMYDPEEIKLLEYVKTIPLTMVECMNSKDWERYDTFLAPCHRSYGWLYSAKSLSRAELMTQLEENSSKNPGWKCEALDVMPHVVRRGDKGQITSVEVLINAKHYHMPDRVVRSMCLTLVFASYWNAMRGSYDWLCTQQKIVPGMD